MVKAKDLKSFLARVAGSNPVVVVVLTTRLAQSVERETFNLVAVGSIPTSGEGADYFFVYRMSETSDEVVNWLGNLEETLLVA